MKKIILTGGGTGGHLFPAIAAAEELALRGFDVELVTDLRCQKFLSASLPFKVTIIDFRIYSGIKGKIGGIFKLCRALIKSIFFILKKKPDFIIGFGGYPTMPIMLGSLLMKVPFGLHEQNSFLGKTNARMSKFAKFTALSFANTKNIQDHKNSILVGSIVSKDLKKNFSKKEYNSKEFNILIFAGSQGATFFSKLMPKAIILLQQLAPNIKIKITQQVKEEDLANLKNLYSNSNIEVTLAPFFYNMPTLYCNADIVICRSGAMTVAELSQVNLPAIYIPYPYAADNHQFYNAQAIEEAGGGWLFLESDLTAELLASKLLSLIENPNLLKQVSQKLRGHRLDGAKLLANTIEKFLT